MVAFLPDFKFFEPIFCVDIFYHLCFIFTSQILINSPSKLPIQQFLSIIFHIVICGYVVVKLSPYNRSGNFSANGGAGVQEWKLVVIIQGELKVAGSLSQEAVAMVDVMTFYVFVSFHVLDF